jgi:hypothetical protein
MDERSEILIYCELMSRHATNTIVFFFEEENICSVFCLGSPRVWNKDFVQK